MNNVQKNVINELLKNPYEYANKISIKDLVSLLKLLDKYYYNTKEELVPDEIYDLLKEILIQRNPLNIYIKKIGAPISKAKVKLPYYMPSLDKIKPDTKALNLWIKKYKGPYILSDKLDGVSGLFIKNTNDLKLYSRGDGKMGQDISHLIPYIISDKVDLTKLPDNIAIRGELIISKLNFKLIKEEFKNGRNAVAGLVNSKKYSTKVAKLTDFIAYSIVNPQYTQKVQMQKLHKYNFPTSTYIEKQTINNKLISDYLIFRRKEGSYDIDGIVVVDSSKIYNIQQKNPKYAFAFKIVFTDQIAEATIIDIEWTCSMHGYLKPKIKIMPIKLGGVVIQFATAFNAKFVVDNKLGPGAKIKIIRSGDVIPHIMEVLKPAAVNKPKLPDVPYYWTDTKIDIIVKDIHGACKDTIIVKRLTHFFKIINVKYISEGIITKFVENGYNSLIKILIANPITLAEIDGIGKKIVDKLYTNIKNAFKKISLAKLMAASTLFGRGFGGKRLKLIIDIYPDILTVDWNESKMINKLIEIDGFDEITAEQFTKNLPKFKKFLEDLKKVINMPYLKNKIKNNNKFKDQKIVFTGFRDNNLQEFIENNGGSVTNNVSKNTNIVVYSNTEGNKYKKAKELNIRLITLEIFKKKFMD